MPGRLNHIFLAAALTVALALPARGADNPKDSFEWWKPHAVTAASDPRVGRAEAIFKRVLDAADQSDARLPRLVVIKDQRDPYAEAIPDGTIILSFAGIDACYAGVPPGKGDARLAFILGHELSHLSKNDFWHEKAYRSARQFAGGGQDLKNAADFILKAADLGEGASQEVAKVKELEADSYGIVYMALAGYDPHAVVDRDGGNFFQDYVTQITGQVAYRDERHPTPGERAQFLRSQLARVAEEVDLFQVGVRYYQQGRYQDAIGYFDRFRERFPGREVFNNLGICYYQLALERLTQCDQSLALRFRLPVLLDTDTLAQALRGSADGCAQDKTFLAYIGQAVRHLELARSKDARYLPARLNLASAYIMAADYTAALAAAEDALRLQPRNPEALGLKGVALYLFGGVNGVETGDAALALLQGISPGAAPSAALLYNMAAIERGLGRTGPAREHLEAFLRLEGSGSYAALAQRLLGRKPPPAQPGTPAAAPKSPLALGDLKGEAIRALTRMTKREVTLGRDEADLYRGPGVLAVVRLEGTTGIEIVDLVEADQTPPLPLASFLRAYGPPRREIAVPAGTILVYDGFAADLEGGAVRRLTFCNRESL